MRPAELPSTLPGMAVRFASGIRVGEPRRSLPARGDATGKDGFALEAPKEGGRVPDAGDDRTGSRALGDTLLGSRGSDGRGLAVTGARGATDGCIGEAAGLRTIEDWGAADGDATRGISRTDGEATGPGPAGAAFLTGACAGGIRCKEGGTNAEPLPGVDGTGERSTRGAGVAWGAGRATIGAACCGAGRTMLGVACCGADRMMLGADCLGVKLGLEIDGATRRSMPGVGIDRETVGGDTGPLLGENVGPLPDGTRGEGPDRPNEGPFERDGNAS